MSNFERGSLKQRAIAVAVASCYLTSAQANPTGGSVGAGNVVFDVNGKMLTITNTPGSIINWQQFSIQKDEITRFIQQNASSAVLNRVGGVNNPSYILGTLRSELANGAVGGRVFLINPSGVFFGPGSVVNVGGLVASTLGMSDADFATAAAGGRMRFVGVGGEKGLRNAGEIRTAEGGHVYLIAPKVVNAGPTASNPAGGVITSPKGEVIIAAGTSVELVNPGTPDIRVELTAPSNTAVNAGQIIAASGRIGIYGTLIKNSGLVSASAVALGDGGKIVFKALKDVTLDASSRIEANGAKGGDITIQAETGTLLAQGVIEAKGAVEKGGKIQLLGTQVGLTGNAQVDASGQSGGGTVLIGGDERGANPDVQNADAVYLGADTAVRADALASGDGGKVVVYSKNATRAYGTLSARGSASGLGGFVETSGHYLEVLQGPLVSGGLGGGSWLIDPYNIDIVAGNGTSNNAGIPDFTPSGDNSQIGATLISGQLNVGTSVTVDTGGPGSPGMQAGNINVNAGISKGAVNSSTLTLNAASDININAVPGPTILMNSGAFTAHAGGNMTVSGTVQTQTMDVNVGGNLSVVGNAGATTALTGTAGQTISAGSIDVRSQGGSAAIQTFAGDQTITVNGAGAGIDVRTTTPGTNGVSTSASIFSGSNTGTQTITVNNGDRISLNAGFGGARILANGTQTVSANTGDIQLTNSTTGFLDSFAGILAPKQTITAGRDVTLTANFATGTSAGIRIGSGSNAPTDLTLKAGRDVVLTGGVGTNVNGAALGSSLAATGANNITVNADGRMIMNSGADAGTRIGSLGTNLTGGDIKITAASIEMNGTAQNTAIRTLDNVNLTANGVGGAITQGAKGIVQAGTLTTTSNGDTSLTGKNLVSSYNGTSNFAGITLNNSGPLTVTGLKAVGDTTITNSGAMAITGAINTGGGALNLTTTAPGSSLAIFNKVTGGVMNLNAAGALSVSAAGTQDAIVSSNGGQTVTAQSLSVTAQDGRTASISNFGSGEQTVTISGAGASAGIDVQTLGPVASFARIDNNAVGAGQTIQVFDADHINVNGAGAGSPVQVSTTLSSNGAQSISITGSGANAITVGGSGSLGGSTFSAAGSQSVVAGVSGQAGSIVIRGPAAGNSTGFFTTTGAGSETQSISTSGTLSMTGGSAASGFTSGIVHNRQGEQTISAANVVLQGGSAGNGNAVSIASNSTGQQHITASSLTLQGGSGGSNNGVFVSTNGGDQNIDALGGSISITGGATGSGNRAGFFTTNGNQTITGNPSVTLTGGANGGVAGNGNNAFIQGAVGRSQTILADSVSVTSGAGGVDNSGSITGGTQLLSVAGNVTVTGSGSLGNSGGSRIGGLGGQATDLTIGAGGDVVLTGGSAPLGGARLGAAVSATPLASKVTVNANGNVILNGGTGQGAAIGYSVLSVPGGGDISVSGNSIQLNGNGTTAAIRTTGNVTLTAGSINEGANSSILANGLTTLTRAGGSTNLTGANQVASLNGTTLGGDLTLNNSGALNITSLSVAGNTALTNAGTVTVSGASTSTGTLAITTTGAGSNLAVTNSLSSTGSMNLNVAGSMSVSASGTQNASVSSTGGQTVNAQSLSVTAQDGRSASLANIGSGNQTISVSGGSGINVVASSGNAVISNSAPGGAQIISATGSGANAINVGSAGASGSSNILVVQGSQSITAGAAGEVGSIAIVGPAASGRSAGISTSGSGPDTQSISTSGALTVTGGTAASGFGTGIFHNRQGEQTVNAASISVQGGASGSGNFATIAATGLGKQTINAGSISVTSGAGGTDNSATILAASQVITTTGNFIVNGAGSTGPNNGPRVGGMTGPNTATDLTLNVGGDVIITAGSTSNSGAGLGSINVTPPFANKIKVNAAGSVILNAGTGAGARIGSSNGNVAGGNISVTAGNSIQLNGNATQTAAIRTTGDVSLTAGTISESTNGLILANGLTLKTSGNADLTGQNRVSSLSAPTTALPGLPPTLGVGGNLSFNNTGALSVGSTTVGGAMSLTTTSGDLNVTSLVTSAGAMNVNAAGALNVNGAGLQDAGLLSNGGQTISAQSVNLTAQNNRLSSIENRGSGSQTITATAGGVNLQALGGSGAAQIINGVLGGSQIVSMSGLLNVLGGNVLRGTPATSSRNSGIFQNANALQQVSSSGITLEASATGTAVPSGAFISSAGSQVIDAGGGSINLVGAAGGTGNSAIINNSGGPQTVSAGSISLQAGAGGSGNNASINSTNGGQTITAKNVSLQAGAGSSNVASLRTLGTTGDQILNVTGGSLTVTGGTTGNGNQAAVTSTGNQTITGNANITVTGGASGGVTNNANNAVISATAAGKQQTITAGSISVSSGAGGIDNSGTITGATQTITTTGNVTVSGGATTGTSNGSRIGGLSGGSATDTNLTLTAGGDVILTGGSADNSGARLGSAATTSPLTNNVTVNAGGSVILNGGTAQGAAIGYSVQDLTIPPAGGNILVTAGNAIQLNGGPTNTSIRTLGDVTLNAGTISEGSNGFILANNLTLKTSGNATLTGPNQVSTLSAPGTVVAGVPPVTIPGVGGSLSFNNAGALKLNDVSSGGAMNLTAAGGLTISASGTQNAVVSSSGGQTISAQSLIVSAQDGRTASLSNNGGTQTINIAGGGASAGIDVQTLSSGGSATIASNAVGSTQSISVTNADHINVNGAGGNASINANAGTQTISITGSGSGANAINLGSSGALGSSTLNALAQTVTAGAAGQSGSITIVGPAANNRLAAITTTPGTGGETQTVSTSGTISVTGGTAPAQGANSNSGIFHSRQGQQSVSAANIVLQGGASGNGNGAFINSLSGGDQTVNVTGLISITGGTGVAGNKAGMNATNASQTISAGAINITGGASGGIAGNGNNGFLQSSGATKVQTVNAGSISVTAGAGGIDNSGSITGMTQTVTATGNVTLTGGGTTGTSNGARIGGAGGGSPSDTNLTLNAGGNVILNGGSADGSGARLGSAAVATPLTNNVIVNAGGSVILNGGTAQGAAIGYSVQAPTPPAGGTIKVTAGNSIQLNGGPKNTSIRTLGDVTLTAGNTISEGANGFILANALTTTSGGDTSLTGPNQVASFTGTSTSGSVTFNNIGALAVNSVVAANNIALTNLGAMSINGAISTPSGSVSLNAESISEGASGLIAANSLTLKTSGNADLTGANQVSTLDAPGTVVPGVPPTLVPGVGGNLSFNNTAALSVGSTAVGGALNLTTTSGDLNVTNVVTSGGAMNVNAAGALNVNGAGLQDAMLLSNGGQTLTAQSVNLTAQNNRPAIIQNQGSGSQTITATAGGINLQALGGSGVAQIVNSALGGSQIVSMTGLLNVLGGTTNIPNGGRNSGIFQNGTGVQSVTASGITLQASPTGNAAPSGAQIAALGGGDQVIDAGVGDISLIAGSGGTANNASILGSGNQNIHAHNISAANGTGGTNAFAGILAPHQTLTATGDVTLTSQAGLAAGGSLPGVRIGGNGGATDLNLHADGNLTLNGGTAANNGIGIGSSAVGTPLANSITITTGGSVILNSGTASGTGARIGAGPNGNAGGNISITAGGDIQLNGTAQPTIIRTLDNINLSAANISEGANGFILANGLTTTSSGSTSLTGPNQVSTFNASGANLTLNNSGALLVTGVNSGGNTTLSNAGAVTVAGAVNIGGTLGVTTTGAGADLAIANNVFTGAMNLNVAGGLSVTGSGTQSAFVFSQGGQTINAQSLTVSGQNGQAAVLGTSFGGSQNIAISGGGVNIQALTGGSAQLSTQGPGGNQTIAVSNGPGINVNGSGGNAIVISSGAQTLSTTGSGANAINVGSAGAAGASNIIGQGQSITAASIAVQGGASGSNHGAFISSQGSQTINATTVSVQGGAGGSNNVASVSSTGTQAITAANVAVQGGSGTGNGAFITSNGDQTINANTVSVTGGTVGNGNRALITTIANQTIAASQNIAVTGGASGGIAGSSNFAGISGGGLGMLQKINAGSISVSSGAGGIDNSATITGAKQIITATGNVTVSGSGSTGTLNGSRIGGVSAGASSTATDLTLTADGDVILTGGSVPLAGARLGSTGGTTPLANNITVTAGGSVILNEGPAIGSAIGYSSLVGVPAGGNISVTAGNSIQLNGATAIRTLGNVTLAAGTIGETSNGVITANNLTTTSVGDTNLAGPNHVSSFSGSSATGSVTFNNIGALAVNSIVAANNAALTNLGAMSVNGPMSTGGTLSVTADSINGAGNIATNGGFIVNVAGESLLSGVISGAGGLSKQGAGTLTVSGNNTYAGETDVLAGTLALGGSDRTNSGLVNIFSGATYRGSAGTFNNVGVIEGNGTLDVSATSFTNSGTLRPGGSGAIGTLTVLGNATFGPSGLIDIEAQGAGSGNHDVLAITGAAALDGHLNVSNINGYAPLADDAITPVTYASRSGTLGINPDSWLPTYNPASLTLVFDPNVNRWIGTSGNWNVAANWSRGHTPLAFETALIDVAGNQLVTVSDGARAAGKLRSSEDFLISGGSLSLGGPSFFYGALSLTGGTLQGAGNVTVNGAFNWSGGSLAGAGQFITAPTALSTLAPSAHNLMLGRTWLNQGHVMWQSSNGHDLVIAEGASLVNALGGEVTLAAAQGGNIKGDGAFSNAGTVNKNGVDTNAIKAAFTNSATGVLNVNSGTLKLKRSASNEGSVRIAGGATLLLKQDYVNYGRISGNGVLDATAMNFTNSGILAPGSNDGLGIGTFTIRGDYHQGPAGVLDMGLGGVAAGQYDVLAVSDKAFLGGTLQTSAVNGYAPTAGDSFKLITYKSRSGEFSTLTAPAGLALDANYMKRFGIFELE